MNAQQSSVQGQDLAEIAVEIQRRISQNGGIFAVSHGRKSEMVLDLPNRVSNVSYLNRKDRKRKIVKRLCQVTWKLYRAFFELYQISAEFRNLINFDKTDSFYWQSIDALFLRIDGAPTQNSIQVFEWGQNWNGTGWMNLIKLAYASCGKAIAVPQNRLKQYLNSIFYSGGTIAYTEESLPYAEDFEYLAEEIFSAEGKPWDAQLLGPNFHTDQPVVLKAWATWESGCNPYVQALIKSGIPIVSSPYHPVDTKIFSLAIFMEQFEDFLLSELGADDFDFIQSVTPYTTLVEVNSPSYLSHKVQIMENNRMGVLKKVDGEGSCGGNKVYLLSEYNPEKCFTFFEEAENDTTPWILQDFQQVIKRKIPCLRADGTVEYVDTKPLYRIISGRDSDVLEFSVIACPGTNKLHLMVSAAHGPMGPII